MYKIYSILNSSVGIAIGFPLKVGTWENTVLLKTNKNKIIENNFILIIDFFILSHLFKMFL